MSRYFHPHYHASLLMQIMIMLISLLLFGILYCLVCAFNAVNIYGGRLITTLIRALLWPFRRR